MYGYVHSMAFIPMCDGNRCVLEGHCNPSFDTSGTAYECIILFWLRNRIAHSIIGSCVPPMFIFPRVRMSDRLLWTGLLALLALQVAGWIPTSLWAVWSISSNLLNHHVISLSCCCYKCIWHGAAAQSSTEEDWNGRRNNIVLYNIPENNEIRADDRKKEDAVFCLQLFNIPCYSELMKRSNPRLQTGHTVCPSRSKWSSYTSTNTCNGTLWQLFHQKPGHGIPH